MTPLSLIRRDLSALVRRKQDIVNPVVFYLVVIALFPLGVGPDPRLLSDISTGIIWVALSLAVFLGLEHLFRDDFEDGSLEQLLLSPSPRVLMVGGRLFVHWLSLALPLLLITPLICIMLGLPEQGWGVLLLSLLLGSPSLVLWGGVGAALTVGVRQGGVLLSMLVLPLYVPVLVFGVSAVQAAIVGLPYLGQLAILGALLALALLVAPLAIVAALKVNTQ